MTTLSTFEENYNGIPFNGETRVAKGGITQLLLNVADDKKTVLVRGSKIKSYNADVHKDLYNMMDFCKKGDKAIIKWKLGKPYLIGFIKRS